MKFFINKFVYSLAIIGTCALLLSPVILKGNWKVNRSNYAKPEISNKLSKSNQSKSEQKVPSITSQKIPAQFQTLQKKYQLISIPTYDGSYQLTHPKILYLSNGWNGYKYWMSMTPYPNGNDDYENPSIVVSNDGMIWITLKGLKNPVSGIPKDVKAGGHYSDSNLFMRGNTMELWYRYNPALMNQTEKSKADNSINIYFRRMSKDGVHWTNPQKLMQSNDGHLSLCGFYDNGDYNIWYATYNGFLYYSQSKDALKWSSPIQCTVPLPNGYIPYHQDIIRNGSQYYLLQTAEKKANYTFQLFILNSKDGIHFNNTQQVYPNNDKTLWKDVSFYRSTLFVKDNKLDFYISLIIPNWNWYITKTETPIQKTDKRNYTES